MSSSVAFSNSHTLHPLKKESLWGKTKHTGQLSFLYHTTEPSLPAAAPLNPTKTRGTRPRAAATPPAARSGITPLGPRGPPPKDKAARLPGRPCRGPSPRSSRGGTSRGRGTSARGSAAGLHSPCPTLLPGRAALPPPPSPDDGGGGGAAGKDGEHDALAGPGRYRPPGKAPRGPPPATAGQGMPFLGQARRKRAAPRSTVAAAPSLTCGLRGGRRGPGGHGGGHGGGRAGGGGVREGRGEGTRPAIWGLPRQPPSRGNPCHSDRNRVAAARPPPGGHRLLPRHRPLWPPSKRRVATPGRASLPAAASGAGT